MTGLFYTVGFLWFCFVTTAVSEKVLPPDDVRLSWNDGLHQELSWTPPKHSTPSCDYRIWCTIRDRGHESNLSDVSKSSPWKQNRILNGGYLRISIQTVCNGSMSEAVSVGLNDPDVPVSCVIKSSTLARCSWTPPPSAQLSFFYRVSIPSPGTFDALRECAHYNSMRTSCDLEMDPNEELQVKLNGTLSNRTIRNSHQFTSVQLSLPPLNWTVKESKDWFRIMWDPPEIPLHWKYTIRYTACEKTGTRVTDELFYELKRDPECPYSIALRGEVEYFEGTEWTLDKHYDAFSGPSPMLFAVALIPLVLVVLVVLASLWCRKNKDKIFPKVPQPNPELFKDLINNNNNINVPNSYLPKAEECEVTLVVDPS